MSTTLQPGCLGLVVAQSRTILEVPISCAFARWALVSEIGRYEWSRSSARLRNMYRTWN